jgi:hypothetical protein
MYTLAFLGVFAFVAAPAVIAYAIARVAGNDQEASGQYAIAFLVLTCIPYWLWGLHLATLLP